MHFACKVKKSAKTGRCPGFGMMLPKGAGTMAGSSGKKYKAIKYRVYPDKHQAVMFAKTFGCCHKVYNLMLADKGVY